MEFIQPVARTLASLLGHNSRAVRWLRPGYAWLLERRFGRTGLIRQVHGVLFRVLPRHRAWFGEDHDAPVARFLRSQVRPGALCFNVGANVGIYTLQLAHWSAPDGRVVAFEPNPAAVEALRRHVALNGFGARVVVEPVAIADRPGSALFHATETDGRSRLGPPHPLLIDRATPIEVPVTSLDRYCAEKNLAPDWIVMDIEGHEVAALRGAQELIRGRRGKLGLVVEMHPNAWSWAGTDRSGLEALLNELGLQATPLTGQSDPLGEYGIVSLDVSPP